MIRAAALATLAALLLVSTAAWAAGEAWTATRVRGTVIKLVGDRWEEVARGEILTDATLRTLRSGRISMEDGAIAIDVGPNSVLELDSSPWGSATALRQYLGSLTIAGTGRKGVSLQAGRLVVTRIDGHATLTVNEAATSVTVLDGTLSVRGPTGASVDVSAGSYVAADGNTVLLAAAEPDDRPLPNGAGPGNGNGDSKGNQAPGMPPQANGNGNGPAGNNGSPPGENSGQGKGPGSANGNGNGPGSNNGNANGNGQGNNNGKGRGSDIPDVEPVSPADEEPF